MQINKLLLLANGEPCPKAFLKQQVKLNDFLLAADGGANTALKARVMPDMVIGDLDSLTPQNAEKIGEDRLLKVDRQDNTDLEKALDFAAYIKPQTCTILCATGGRIDFTLSNFSSVFKYIDKFEIVFAAPNWRIYPINKTTAFKAKAGATVSLMPMGPVRSVSLSGLKYPLRNAALNIGQTAVSNIAKKDAFKVSLKQGCLLVMVYE